MLKNYGRLKEEVINFEKGLKSAYFMEVSMRSK